MRLPFQIRVRPTTGGSVFGAQPSVPHSSDAAQGITPQGDTRCSDPNTRCAATCTNGSKSCNLARAYFTCDC